MTPSEADRKDAQDWIENIKTDFASTEEDEMFVRKNSDVFNRVLYVSKNDLSENIKSLSSSPIGTIIGPFNLNFNTLRLAKLVNVSARPDSVKARHILISSKNAEVKIDSLKNTILNGQSFATLAQQFLKIMGQLVRAVT